MSTSHQSGDADQGVSIYDEAPRLTLTELAHRERKGVSTIWRWCLKGVRGHKLESFLHGGTRCTTGPAVRRFYAVINSDSPLSVKPRTNRQREAAIAAAERALREAGV